MSNTKKRTPTTSDRRRKQVVREVTFPARANKVLAAGLIVYLGILAAMVAFDSYTFVLKSAVIPLLLIAAVLSQRFQGFVNDWAVFLGAVVLFDSLRSLEFAVTTYFKLPVYAGYAIASERWLCGGAVLPLRLQQWRATLSDPYWIDRFFVLVHASHFLFFLLFGFILWYLRRDVFRTYAVAMITVLYVALLLHFLVPTIPPWLAVREFGLLPPIERLIHTLYNANLPTLFAMFDVNPVAAMPSLHTAMPALCAFVAMRYLGWRGLIVVAYAVAVAVGVIYLGEHYAVDVVAGVMLAAAVYAGVHLWGAPPANLMEAATGPITEPLARRSMVGGVALVAVAFAFGPLTSSLLGPFPITVAFIERELVGRSPAANYLLGRLALDDGDLTTAKTRFTLALKDLPGPAEQQVIRDLLRQSEARAVDLPASTAAAAPLRR